MPIPDILIAEDDPVLREAYTRKFSHTKCTLRTAENGEIAVRMIQEKAPSLLICDIMMPEHDGWWVLEHCTKKKRSFPVIMLTNLEDDDTSKRSAKLADGYFVKRTMTLESLVEMTKTLLSKKPKK